MVAVTETEAQAMLDAYEWHNAEMNETFRYKSALTHHKGDVPGNANVMTFAMWPYSDKSAIDKAFAFWCTIKETGEALSGSDPIGDNEATALYERSFSD